MSFTYRPNENCAMLSFEITNITGNALITIQIFVLIFVQLYFFAHTHKVFLTGLMEYEHLLSFRLRPMFKSS